MKNVFTKTGKKESEKMQKRKTAETTGKVEREGGQRKMRERQNAKSLGAVHTHTHTHTHTQILIQWKNLAIQRCYVNKADLLDSLEQCLAKTGRVFRTQKLEKTGKIFNIKSRLFGNDTSILGNSRAFYTRKMHLKISAKIIFQNI